VERTWKPTTAGILTLISAPFVLAQSFGGALQSHEIQGQLIMWVCLVVGIVAIVGGIFTLRRRIWGLALAGAICATLSLFTFYLGVLAIIFTTMAKKEFS
jgi:vacuolar-type H+-ATPase subunit I/STV1